eukprot:g15294.t1
MSAIFCSLMEVDRISGNSTVVESEQLQKNYKGSIRHAECSEPADAVKIRAEIGGKREERVLKPKIDLTAVFGARLSLGKKRTHPRTLSMAWLVLSAASWSVVLAFALLGIQGTAKLPLGLSLLQIFFARGRKVFGACARSSFAPALPHSDASSDSESEASQSGSS